MEDIEKSALTTVVSKREDPNYSQISGHIPTDMTKEFKIACTKRGVSHSNGLEQAIALWLAQPERDSTGKSKQKDKGTKP
jgi:hypothetical protein